MITRLGRTAGAVAIAAAALIGTVGAGTASASNSTPCRTWTDPYPDGTRLMPCNDGDGTGYDHGYGWVDNSRTDVHVYLEIWSKPWWQAGEPTTLEGRVDEGVMGGPGTGATRVRFDYWLGATPGRTYYTRLWFTDTGVSYGPAESPSTGF